LCRQKWYNKNMKTIENTTNIQLNNNIPTMEDLQNKCLKQELKIEELSALVSFYEEQIRKATEEKFGVSSERAVSGQLTMFNEAEKSQRPAFEEPDLEEIVTKRRKAKGLKNEAFDDLPVEIIEYDLPDSDKNCPTCEEPLHLMKKEIRKELKIVPMQLSIVHHVRYIYACRACEKNEETTPIVKAPMPKPIIPGSFASPSLLAYINNRKYNEALPLYRQEQQFHSFGIDISRQNFSNWVIRSADWLKVIYDRMRVKMLEENYLHADETTVQVLDEKNKSASSNSYMWLFATGKFGPQILLYEYQASRSGKHPKAFLKGFKGFLQTDGYAGYNDIENVQLMGCFAHARRGFTDAIKALPKDADSLQSVAAAGRDMCSNLFHLERTYVDLSADERYLKRLEHSKPVLELFLTWLQEHKLKVLPKSSLGKAIAYCLNQWPKLKTFLEDGSIELSNNRAERAIKPFVIGRKNWLFSKTPHGASSSAIIYSIIETAKANDLNPFYYLKFLFETLPNIDILDSDQVDLLLPWSSDLPLICKVPKKV